MNYNLVSRYNNLEITQDEEYLDENKYDITGEGEYQEDKDDFLARFTEYVGGLENYADDDLDDDWLIDGRGENDEEEGGEGNEDGDDVIVKLDPAEESSSSSDEEYVISKKKKDNELQEKEPQEPQESQEPQEEVEEEVLVEITNYEDDGDYDKEVVDNITITENQEKKKKKKEEADEPQDDQDDQEDVEGSDEKNLMDVDTDDFSGVNELLSQYKEFVYNEN